MKCVNLHRPSSLLAALILWALLCLLSVFIIRGYRDRARLIRDNENERTLNILFTSIRDYDDPGEAVKASDALRERITGIAVYGADYAPVYRWGSAPERFDPALIEGPPRRFGRYTIADRRRRAFTLILHNDRPGVPGESHETHDEHESNGKLGEAPGEPAQDERPRQNQRNQRNQRGQRWPWFFNALSGGDYFYVDISHGAYWNTMYITAALYPLSAALLLALVLAVRRLYLRNIEYRRRIEANTVLLAAQQNLVVLGTAASTLAHEIRNPLHSIKLQTGILKKIAASHSPGSPAGMEEIALIEEEVDRLAALTYRVNDYLRDPTGNPEEVNPGELIETLSRQLCGRSILRDMRGKAFPQDWKTNGSEFSHHPLLLYMDSGRARSVFENIIRNALEAGSPPEELGAAVTREGNKVRIVIEDRGRGIAPEDMDRVFDPFYTSKSAGTGIGLAVSKRFVEAAGGTITLENRPGGGVTAAIIMPARESGGE
ncbi:MAG: HAMP domain-containing histidine kinase [Treponema sp.]|jgi:two-component system sensor histidine kinase HydH|nr:HAMP domain-containing histidine kinase [Treponema sp.]